MKIQACNLRCRIAGHVRDLFGLGYEWVVAIGIAASATMLDNCTEYCAVAQLLMPSEGASIANKILISRFLTTGCKAGLVGSERIKSSSH